jgi:hypothetical protein
MLQIMWKIKWSRFHWRMLKKYCQILNYAIRNNEFVYFNNEWIPKSHEIFTILKKKISGSQNMLSCHKFKLSNWRFSNHKRITKIHLTTSSHIGRLCRNFWIRIWRGITISGKNCSFSIKCRYGSTKCNSTIIHYTFQSWRNQ